MAEADICVGLRFNTDCVIYFATGGNIKRVYVHVGR